MNCPFCNYPNDHNAPFCVNCGAALPSEKRSAQRSAKAPPPAGPQWTQQPPAPQAAPPAPGPSPYAQPGAPYQAQQQPPQAPYPPQPQAAAEDWQALYSQARPQPLTQAAIPKKKGSKGCIIAAVIVGILFIIVGIVGVIFYFTYSKARTGALELKTMKVIELQKKEQEKKAAETALKEQAGSTEKEGPSAGGPGVNPLAKNPPLADLYQSQIFKRNDRIPYAGLTFSLKKDILLYKPAMLPVGVKAKKGTWMADVAIQVEGKAKMKKFKLTLIDGAGAKLKPDDSFEKNMSFPGGSGEAQKLWKKVSKISRGAPVVLHRGFPVAGKNAHSFLVEIKNQNLDRALWIEAGHAMASK